MYDYATIEPRVDSRLAICKTDVGEITVHFTDLEMRVEPMPMHTYGGMDMINTQHIPYYKGVRINSYELVDPEKTLLDMMANEVDKEILEGMKEVALGDKQEEKKSKKYIIPVIMIGSFIGYKVLKNVFW